MCRFPLPCLDGGDGPRVIFCGSGVAVGLMVFEVRKGRREKVAGTVTQRGSG